MSAALPCVCEPNPFQCTTGCQCVGCGHLHLPALLFGFDSSLTHFGYAVAQQEYASDPEFLACGVWATKPDADARTRTEDLSARCVGLFQQLDQLRKRFECPPSRVRVFCEALALPFGRTAMQTLSTLGRARGLVDAFAAPFGSVSEVQPVQLKRLVTGDPKASKADVIASMRRLYPSLDVLLSQVKPANVEHAADAAASIHAVLKQEQQQWRE